MKYCSTILVGLLCTAACLAQTPLPESRRTSPEIFIYKPDARELRELHVKGAAPDEGMLHTFVGKYAAAEKIPQLPRGNYLRVWTDGNELVYSDHVVDNFYYRLVKDEQVMLILCDTLGNTIDDAVVKRGSKRMKYDPATRTYNLPRIRGEEATVEVNNDGVLHYITIANEPDYTYRPGFFKTAWGKVKTAFKRVFAPGKLPARDKYDGFVVFSKPRYKPGETVKFKAHINRKGKPLDGKVDVALVSYYSPSIDTTLVSLAPYRPGMYAWEFRLSDSLRLHLDKDYTLRFRTGDKRANNVTGRFRYEEYELGKLTFTARADKQKYARGDTVRISLSAVDENNMPVYDGRVKVLVKPARYMGCKFLARTAFVPDRLWEHTFGMEGKSTKEIILPDSIFVDGVSMYYDVACSFFDAGNERRDERISLYRDARRRRIDYSADQGMLALRELYDGKSVESRALVTAYNPEYGIVWQDSVTLPCSVPLSWIVSEYEVQSATASEDIEVGKLPGELIGHRFFRWDGNVRLVVNNPAKFPFWYTICMGDKTIAKGYATELDFARKDNGRKGYSMQIAYLQGENARTIRGELPFTEKNITMEVKTAATVYPGQSAKVEVAVKDRKGRPVKNADVTAYAFTSKFEALPPEVTIYGKGHHPEKLRSRRGFPLQHPQQDGLAAVAAAHGTRFDRILQIPLPGAVLRLHRGSPRKTHPAIPLCGRRRGSAGYPCPVDRRTTPLFQTGAATDAVQFPDMAGTAHAAAAHLRQGGDRRERLCGRRAEDHRFGRRRTIRSATLGGFRGQPSRTDLRPGIRKKRERHAHAARDSAANAAHDYGRQNLRESNPAHRTAGQAILLHG